MPSDGVRERVPIPVLSIMPHRELDVEDIRVVSITKVFIVRRRVIVSADDQLNLVNTNLYDVLFLLRVFLSR